MKSIYAIKHQMTQTWDKSGKRHVVTVVKTPPLTVTQVKSSQTKDGYNAIQVGFGTPKKVNKPLANHLKAKTRPSYLKELNLDKEDSYQVGDLINGSDVLSVGDMVTVRGTSIGKGFAGVMKRWGFAGGPRTHGQSDRSRAPGSIGQGTDPGRVHKGKKMAGRMGNQQVAVENLLVVSIDAGKQEIWLSGPVPGSAGSVIKITKKGTSVFPGLVGEHDQVEIKDSVESSQNETKSTSEPQS
jgi:large subunit ribosomal protein L3